LDLIAREGAAGTVDVDEDIESSVVDALMQVSWRGKGERQEERGKIRAERGKQ
jgi:hypothetical protein